MQRLRLEIAGDPRAGDTLEVASWARQWERVGALRDFEVRTPGGERVAAGASRWLVSTWPAAACGACRTSSGPCPCPAPPGPGPRR